MTERPVFLPEPTGPALVRTLSFAFSWHGGFAPTQKKKNVDALHAAARQAGFSPLLEISTKSDEKLGRHLSAFHLRVRSQGRTQILLECAFQGSKVFESGGPFTDLYSVEDPRLAKRDERLRASGKLKRFEFDGSSFPLEPETVFYDWLYITAIYPHREWLRGRLPLYVGFTDIEFNPARSINCQARSCALFVSLMARNLLDEAVASPSAFLELMKGVESDPGWLRTGGGLSSRGSV